MLVGLLFAIEPVEDDPGRPVASLPFAGITLIEHQARRLIAAGVRQIVVVAGAGGVSLRGIIRRIERRGVTVDVAAGLAEAAQRVHPLARVLVLADGLVTTDTAIAASVPAGTGDALLTLAADAAPATYERLGGARAWAGVAFIDALRLGEAARLPADYDPQSTLLRVADAAGAAHRPLPPGATDDGHGIERDPVALRGRERRLTMAAAGGRHGGFDRWIAAPLARLALPRLIAAEAPTSLVGAVGGVGAIGAVVALAAGVARVGMVLAMAATLIAMLATAVAGLRDEAPLVRVGEAAQRLVPALAVLLLGERIGAARADGAPLVTAVALVAAAALAERAAIAAAPRWAGSAPAYLMLVTLATLVGAPLAGLALAACYAAATLAAAIETMRQRG